MREVCVRGIGFWAPGVADWTQARGLIASGTPWPEAAASKPTPAMMSANERRRAPDSVLLAMAVAEQACAAIDTAPGSIPNVFASTYGDLSINDYLCATLASDPASLSPTKFHNSVHNAPSGYWSIATGAMRPSTAIAGFRETFAVGLLESLVQLGDGDDKLMLLVACDIAGAGPMAEVACSKQSFGCALLLDRGADAAGIRLRATTAPATAVASEPAHAGLAMLARTHPIAHGAAALLESLACGDPADFRLRLSPGLDLRVEVRP